MVPEMTGNDHHKHQSNGEMAKTMVMALAMLILSVIIILNRRTRVRSGLPSPVCNTASPLPTAYNWQIIEENN